MRAREIVQAVRNQLRRCDGFQGDEIAKHREEALNYYFQRPRGDEVPGRSHVVAGDLSSMTEANVAMMMDAFTSDRVVEFEPHSIEDEDQAQLEADAVAYLVMGTSDGWLNIEAAIKDAALLRNGVCKVWIDERQHVEYRNYNGVTLEALPELVIVPGMQVKVLNRYDPDKGELRLKLSGVRRRFRFAALPIENFLYVSDWDKSSLQEIPFCAERHVDSRSDMIALGFSREIVDKLPRHRQRTTIEGAARNPFGRVADTHGFDEASELIEWFECYLNLDHDGDGFAERRRICVAGTELLKWSNGAWANDPVNLTPYASGSVLLNAHRMMGISLHDKLKQVQDKNTGLERALFDNINTTTKNRMAYLDGAVNVDDLSDGRPNGAIRVHGRGVVDVRAAVMPFAVPDTSAHIRANIEAVKRERSELGGAALDLASGEMQLSDRMGSEGLDRIYSVREQLAALMTRNIAATLLRNVFLLAHATLREQWNGEIPVKIGGRWQHPNPADWPERLCCEVKPGMSPGERARRAASLEKFLNWQIQLAREGMDDVLVNMQGFFRTLMDWARTVEIRNPEQYWLDPASQESQQALQAKQQAAEEMEAQKRALMSQAIGLEQLRTAFDKYRQDTDLQFRYWDGALKAEIEEAKIVGDATAKLIAAKEKPADAPRPNGRGGKPGGKRAAT